VRVRSLASKIQANYIGRQKGQEIRVTGALEHDETRRGSYRPSRKRTSTKILLIEKNKRGEGRRI